MSIIRIGHKGADALVPGNTIASFEKAVEVGVDLIEFDVLWLAGRPPEAAGRPALAAGRRPRLARGSSEPAADPGRGPGGFHPAAARRGGDQPRHQAARPRGRDRRVPDQLRPARPGPDLDHGDPDPEGVEAARARSSTWAGRCRGSPATGPPSRGSGRPCWPGWRRPAAACRIRCAAASRSSGSSRSGPSSGSSPRSWSRSRTEPRSS